MFATETGNECLLKLLLKSVCDVNIGFKLWITPVLVAFERNFNNCVQLLIHLGANVNTKFLQGEKLLTIAAQNGNYTAMHYLLNAGAAISMNHSLGNTALMGVVGFSAIPKYSLILKADAQMYLLHQMKLKSLMF